MQKYHSVFLSEVGEVYSCGHGQDGRLGLETEQTRMSPSKLKIAAHSQPCRIKQIAAGDNHTVFLSHDGNVGTVFFAVSQLNSALICS